MLLLRIPGVTNGMSVRRVMPWQGGAGKGVYPSLEFAWIMDSQEAFPTGDA